MTTSSVPTSPLARPKKQVQPQQFYEHYLPMLWEHLRAETPWSLPGTSLALTIEEPSQHRTFYLFFDENRLLCADSATHPPPLVHIRSSLAAWKLAVHDLWPRIIRWVNRHRDEVEQSLQDYARHRAPLFSAQAWSAHSGTIHIHFIDDAGDSGDYFVQVGEGGPKHVRVAVEENDVWTLLDNRHRWTDLFHTSLSITGDAAYLLKLVRLLEQDPHIQKNEIKPGSTTTAL
jgi:hypothetical protein